MPEFERMLVRSGIILVKYWFSITDEEQEFRFTDAHPRSAEAVEALARWISKAGCTGKTIPSAKEEMFERTHSEEAPWWVVEAVDKKRARLIRIAHPHAGALRGGAP